VKQGCWWP